jgi:hypothetical protein
VTFKVLARRIHHIMRSRRLTNPRRAVDNEPPGSVANGGNVATSGNVAMAAGGDSELIGVFLFS